MKRFATGVMGIMLGLAILLAMPVEAFSEDAYTLNVGYWDGYGVSLDRNGQPYGYTVDYIDEIAKINGWNVKFIPCQWAEGVEKLQTGELDIFGPMQKTPEREKILAYSQLAAGYEYGMLYAREENDEIFYDDFESLNGKVLGTPEGNYYTPKLLDYCNDNGISLRVKIINDTAELARQYESGEVDLRISGSPMTVPGSKIVLQFSVEQFYYPTGKNNKRVIDGMNYAMDRIQMDNIYFDAELSKKHYTQAGLMTKAFTRQEIEYIDSNPVVKVAIVPYEALGSNYNSDTNQLEGVLIDIMAEVSRHSKLQFEYHVEEDMIIAAEKVRAGDYDALLGVSDNRLILGELKLQSTEPLYHVNLAFIVRQGLNYASGQDLVLAIPERWLGVQTHLQTYYPIVEVKKYQTVAQCMDAMLDGEADVAVQDVMDTYRVLRPAKYSGLSVNTMQYSNYGSSIGLATDTAPELVSLLNKAISSIDDTTRYDIIYKHTIAQPFTPSFGDLLRYNAPWIMCSVLIVILLLYILSINSRKKLNRLAYYDTLTGEMNLNKFKIESTRMMSGGKTYAVMVLDVNKFKAINDIYGYDFGDKVIKLIAATVREARMPGSIISHGDADKFYICFEHENEASTRAAFAQLVAALEQARQRDIPSCSIVINAGVYVVGAEEKNMSSIIDRANMAIKEIKGSHECTLAYYDKSMYDKLTEEKEIENIMHSALRNREFVVYLQPKVELRTMQITGAEALVRWQRTGYGMMYPDSFIPVFEKNGFIIDMDLYVLEQVCVLLKRRKLEGKKLFSISVNLSRRHLMIPNTARTLYSVVSWYDVDPSLIELELTESAFDNRDIYSISKLFDELHGYGFTVSIDDFGAGYSSLLLLKELPIDLLKLDKSFFRYVDTGPETKSDTLLESVIDLTRKLNIKSVSEGVETAHQVELLKRLGCDFVQGYYFAKPMPAEDLEKLFDNSDVTMGNS